VLSEQGRPEDGTDNEGVNMSETFVRLAPRESWRKGWDKERLVAAMRASLIELPGVSYNFSQPIKDNVEEAVSGVRGKVVLKVFGTDLDVMRNTLEAAISSIQKVPGVVDLGLYRDSSVPQLQLVLDRPALARAGISVTAAQDVVETALSGRVTTELWENERPVPVRVLFPLSERDGEAQIAQIQVPGLGGGRVPLGDVAQIGKAMGKASINREANSRMLALKFNVEGRDMGSAIKEAMDTVHRELKVPDGNFLVWGGEFENQDRALKRLALIVPLSFLVVFALLYLALGSASQRLDGGGGRPAGDDGRDLRARGHGDSAVGQRRGGLHRAAGPGLPRVAAGGERRRRAAQIGRRAEGGAGRGRGEPVPRGADDRRPGDAGPDAGGDQQRRGQRDPAAVRGGDHRRPAHGGDGDAVRAADRLQPDRPQDVGGCR